jgi:hypothetical protein
MGIILIIGVSLAICIFMIIMVGFSIYLKKLLKIVKNSNYVNGKITNIIEKRKYKQGIINEVTYEYTVNGNAVKKCIDASPNKYTIFDDIKIRYEIKNPENGIINSELKNNIFMCVVFIIVSIPVIYILSKLFYIMIIKYV